jgi:sulfotransferase family protein
MDSGDRASAVAPGVSPGDGTADSTRASLGDRDPLSHPLGSRSLAGTAKLAMRTALLAASRPTASARMLPTFLIVGAARCGTTSMFGALSQHPAVGHPLLPWTREVHFFDNRYDHGLAWYRSHFPLRARMEHAAREVRAKAPQAFESGIYYMFHPVAPERIKRDLPDVKLLVLLRDPVERAFSSHAYSVAAGCETETFERALELEDSRLVGEVERIAADPTYDSLSHRHHSYRIRGQYIEQLERLEKLFGRERIHVVDSADFFADPAPSYEGVLEFLGLSRAGYPDFKHLNARPRPAPMPDSVRASLREHYRPYDVRLVNWLGYEPAWCR